ncbi:acetate--CoA ligase family protein [Chloroflexota bacterium]
MDNTVKQIGNILNAKSISIVGASGKEGSFGRLFLEGMTKMGCQHLYPVHPRDAEILGLKAYLSILDIPEPVDVALLLTPPDSVMGLVKQCVEKKYKGVIIFAAGFGEKSAEGKKKEQEIARTAREGGVRVIGPNCLGFYSPSASVLTFPQALMEGVPAETGVVGGFSQSGSFVDYLVWFLARKGLRFSKVVSCGNECDLAAEDVLEFLGQDEATKVIIGYMEGVKNGRKFFEVARDVAGRKPVILWKGGTTAFGARAAASHTGALAGAEHVWSAMFRQTGIISVSSFEEVVDCALAFSSLPLPKGRRVAIVSGQGGTGVGTSDNCIALGLEVATFSEKSTSRMKQIVPEVGTSIGNPADIGVASLTMPHLYGDTIKILAEDENVDMILVITAPLRKCTQSIADAAKSINKPVVASLFALPEISPEEFLFLSHNGVPTYSEPKRAANVLARLATYADMKSQT